MTHLTQIMFFSKCDRNMLIKSFKIKTTSKQKACITKGSILFNPYIRQSSPPQPGYVISYVICALRPIWLQNHSFLEINTLYSLEMAGDKDSSKYAIRNMTQGQTKSNYVTLRFSLLHCRLWEGHAIVGAATQPSGQLIYTRHLVTAYIIPLSITDDPDI